MAACTIYQISSTGKMTVLNTLEEGLEHLAGNGYLWVEAVQPDRYEFEDIARKLGLHPLAVEDCFNENLVPKMEDYPDITFFIFNSFRYRKEDLNLQEINLFIGRKLLVTVCGYNSEVPEAMADMAKIVRQNPETIKGGPSYLMYLILDRLVDHKFTAIETMEDELDEMEDLVLDSPDSFQIPGLVRIRQQLLQIRKSLFHEREILVKICRKDCPFIAEKTLFHFRDIYDHLNKFFELTETFREMVATQMELFMSVQNYRMTRTSNETNTFIKRLTLITTIFMPLTLLAGIGGMSEYSMMTGPTHWRWAYPLFLVGMVLVGYITYLVLMWFDRRRNKSERRRLEIN
ncbi:MAG: magnesium transporter CorA family protein [Bacteroidales bacterium]